MRAVIVSQPAVWGAARQIELGTHGTASAPKQSNTAGNCCVGDEIRDDGASVSPSHAVCQQWRVPVAGGSTSRTAPATSSSPATWTTPRSSAGPNRRRIGFFSIIGRISATHAPPRGSPPAEQCTRMLVGKPSAAGNLPVRRKSDRLRQRSGMSPERPRADVVEGVDGCGGVVARMTVEAELSLPVGVRGLSDAKFGEPVLEVAVDVDNVIGEAADDR
jgi:hypothetical protein